MAIRISVGNIGRKAKTPLTLVELGVELWRDLIV